MAIDLDLSGQVALVTGGVRGVGLGITRALLDAGADVIAVARRPPDDLPADPPSSEGGGGADDPPRASERVAAGSSTARRVDRADGSAGLSRSDGSRLSLPGSPWSPGGVAGERSARFVSLDVRDAAAVQGLVDGLERLDLVVNNAGGSPFLPVAEGDPRVHMKIIELNLTAPLIVARAAYPALRRTGGSVIMIGSVSGVRPSPGTAAYGAAKAGLLSLTTSLAVEWAPEVRVNAITLGMVRTEQSHLHYGDEAGIAAVAGTVPLGRLAEPYDAGAACVFLASGHASYITGSTLTLHGGGERPAFLAAANVNETRSDT